MAFTSAVRHTTLLFLRLSYILVVLSFFSLPRTVTAVRHGVIGYGISMYKPTCCYACRDSLSSLYLNCTTFDDHSEHEGMSMKMKLAKRMSMGMEMAGSTSDECYANDRVWLETFAYCVKTQCDQEQVVVSKQEKCFAILAANGVEVPTLQNSLTGRPPTVEVAEDAMWLNETSLVNANLWSTNLHTLAEFEASEERHTRYSLIIWLVVVGICVTAGTFSIAGSYLSLPASIRNSAVSKKVQESLFLPALLNNRHLNPLPFNAGYVPSRILSIFIGLYIILNIFFSCVDFHNASPSTWWSDGRSQTASYVANRTGVLSFANLALAILFSGRNNILIAITGWSQTTFITFHRWAARVATVQAIVHSIIYTFTYFWDGGAEAYYAEVVQPYYWWGIIGTVALAVMIGLAVLPIRLRAYEFFVISHIALAILALLGCWYHIDIRFEKRWGYEVWLYLAFAFWAFDRAARLARVVFYNWIGGPTTTAHVKAIPETELVELTVFPSWKWNVGPGQHTFLYLPGLGRCWESHPFTIADWGYTSSPAQSQPQTLPASSSTSTSESDLEISDSKQITTINERPLNAHDIEKHEPSFSSAQSCPSIDESPGRFYIRCLLRARTGTTRSLHTRLSSAAASREMTVYTEGPYSGSPLTTLSSLRSADTVLLIAGGIGITHALGFVKHYLSQSSLALDQRQRLMRNTNRMVLAWSAREMGLIQYVREQFLTPANSSAAGERHVEYRFHNTSDIHDVVSEHDKNVRGTDVVNGRMDIPSLVSEMAEPGRRLVVVVCAPGQMADEVRQAVVTSVGSGMDVGLIEEAFAW